MKRTFPQFLLLLLLLRTSEATVAHAQGRHGGGGGKQGAGTWSPELQEDLDAHDGETKDESPVNLFASAGARFNERPQQATDGRTASDETHDSDTSFRGGVMALLSAGAKYRSGGDSFSWGSKATLTTMLSGGLSSGQLPWTLRLAAPQEWREGEGRKSLNEAVFLSLNGASFQALGTELSASDGPWSLGLSWNRGSQRLNGISRLGNRTGASQGLSIAASDLMNLRISLTAEEGVAQNNREAAYAFAGAGAQIQADWGSPRQSGRVQLFLPVKYQHDFSPVKAHAIVLGPGLRYLHALWAGASWMASVRENLTYDVAQSTWTPRLSVMGVISAAL